MSFGRVAGGGWSVCGVITREACDCGATKRWVARDGHTYLGDPAQPAKATHASKCPCNDHIFGDLRNPEMRLIKALRRQAKPTKKALEARARRDQEYREAIEKAGLDIGRPLGKPRTPPDSVCAKCGSARSQGRCTSGCDGGTTRPNNIGRGKGTR